MLWAVGHAMGRRPCARIYISLHRANDGRLSFFRRSLRSMKCTAKGRVGCSTDRTMVPCAVHACKRARVCACMYACAYMQAYRRVFDFRLSSHTPNTTAHAPPPMHRCTCTAAHAPLHMHRCTCTAYAPPPFSRFRATRILSKPTPKAQT